LTKRRDEKRGSTSRQLERLARLIDGGRAIVQEDQKQIRQDVKDIRAIDATLDAVDGSARQRLARFRQVEAEYQADPRPFRQHAAKMMRNWERGLFAGGNRLTELQDNLNLERWFRTPKSHERRIHGHAHAGVRIVREGPTLLLALDAHLTHPQPFTQADLRPYRDAAPPPDQVAALRRHAIMRRARSRNERRRLLSELEQRLRACV